MLALWAAPSLWPFLRRSRCSRISSVVVRYVSMSSSVMETECQLDVPVTKLSVLSGSQIHHVEMGTDPRQQKPTTPQIHTNMQINYKINITLQTSHPSMTSFWTAQHQSGSTNQPRRQRGWLNASSNPHSLLPLLIQYHSHTVSFSSTFSSNKITTSPSTFSAGTFLLLLAWVQISVQSSCFARNCVIRNLGKMRINALCLCLNL